MIIGEIKKAIEIGRKGRFSYVWRDCPDCGFTRWVVLTKNLSKRCIKCHLKIVNASRPIKIKQGIWKIPPVTLGDKNNHWKGGRILRSDGYVMVYIPPDDFFYSMASKEKYIMEHRLIMARHLSRCLLPWETVHHRNGIKNDNRLENLELLSLYKHAGVSRLQSYIAKLESENAELREQLKKCSSEEHGIKEV